jgi:hypothetical protein
MRNVFQRILRWFVNLPVFRVPPDAGQGPEWAVWVAGVCAALSLVALVEAAIALFNGQSPKTPYVILFGTFAAIAIPFRVLRLAPQAYCLLALAAIAVPLVLTLP